MQIGAVQDSKKDLISFASWPVGPTSFFTSVYFRGVQDCFAISIDEKKQPERSESMKTKKTI